MIIIEVPAIPIAQPRGRATVIHGHARVYEPKKHPVAAFKATVRLAAKVAYEGPPLHEPLSVSLTFVMPRPSSLVWKKREMPRLPHAKKPDADNLTKSVFDALNGLLWVDDSQVCALSVEKWIASGDEQPHVLVEVQRHSEASKCQK